MCAHQDMVDGGDWRVEKERAPQQQQQQQQQAQQQHSQQHPNQQQQQQHPHQRVGALEVQPALELENRPPPPPPQEMALGMSSEEHWAKVEQEWWFDAERLHTAADLARMRDATTAGGGHQDLGAGGAGRRRLLARRASNGTANE